MSKLYVLRDQNGLTFTTNPYSEEPGTEPRLSRRTYLAFARWLKRNVQEEALKPEVVRAWLHTIDLRNRRVRMLRLIKETKDEDLYRTLGLAQCIAGLAKRDLDFAFEIPVYYEEDYYHLLRLYGLSEEDAAEFAAMGDGVYKNYCKHTSQKDQLLAVSEELHTFAKQASNLPSRNWIKWVFKHEYPRFQEEMKRREQEKAEKNLGSLHRKRDEVNDTMKTDSGERKT